MDKYWNDIDVSKHLLGGHVGRDKMTHWESKCSLNIMTGETINTNTNTNVNSSFGK